MCNQQAYHEKLRKREGTKTNLSTSYRDSGVDQDRKDTAVEEALRLAEGTFRPEVIRNPGGFAGLFALGALGAGGKWKDPVLVSGADGVGT